jgi:flagellar hook-basal body complex protein FliE
MNQINSIGPIRDDKSIEKSQSIVPQKGGPSFKDTMNGFLNDVNAMQVKADESIKKMATGQINDVHEVMSSVEQANTAFNMMMEIRNKVMDAYQEVMRIRL